MTRTIEVYRNFWRLVTQWGEQILNSNLYLNYIVNIHNINISFVITVTKSSWFLSQKQFKPSFGFVRIREDFLGFPSIGKKKEKRKKGREKLG